MITTFAVLFLVGHAAYLPPNEGPTYIVDPPSETVNVHVIAHTHDDVGWLHTVDEYYDCCVRHILDTVVQSLQRDPKRKFTYVETAFLSKWWDLQTADVKTQVTKLVNAGQLDFTIGGWCMPDEASPTYTDLIDQMTLGHLWLQETFGPIATPTVGWQIDPFGHSAANTWTNRRFGFDYVMEGRIDHQDREQRIKERTMEVIWTPFRSFAEQPPDMNQVLTGVMYQGYGWPPGRQSGATIKYDTGAFANGMYAAAQAYRTQELLQTFGSDFAYQNAEPEFRAIDSLIQYFAQHPELKLNVFYSTPANYAKSLAKYNVVWPNKTDDFFPYSDNTDDYWTGYFTSHPAFKRLTRAASGFFHGVRAVHTLTSADTDGAVKLGELWRALGVVQHHDSITGTSKQHVYDDYIKQLNSGVSSTQAELLQALAELDPTVPHDWSSCPPALEGPAVCGSTPLNIGHSVAIFNPLAWVRDVDVVLVVASDALCVQTAAGQAVSAQTRPLAPHFELTFLAKALPAMGIATYKIVACSKAAREQPQATNSIENAFLRVDFDDSGKPTQMTDKKTSASIPFSVDVLYYVPEGTPTNPRDGAYVFAANKPAVDFGGPRSVTGTYKGDVFQELEVSLDKDSGVSQRFRLHADEPMLRIITTVGPINVAGRIGKEVIVHVNTQLQTAGNFYTDSNGMEMMLRSFNKRFSFNLTVDNPISGNYYPIATVGLVKDAQHTLALLCDRGQGFASLSDGSMEAMIHRRLVADGDHKGVGEPLDDKTVISAQHVVVLSAPASAMRLVRTKALEHEHPPIVIFSTDNQAKPLAFAPMANALPANLHMTTLQVYAKGATVAPGEGQVILRLQHLYGIDEDEQLSVPATVDLATLFSGWQVLNATETNLSASYAIKGFTGTKVTVQPMDVRTFLVQMNRK